MLVAFYSARTQDRDVFSRVFLGSEIQLTFFPERLDARSASTASGHQAVCAFVDDDLGAETLHTLKAVGVELLALRSAGFDHVDRKTAQALGLSVVHVPSYSPESVAEHAVAILLSLMRHVHHAYTLGQRRDLRLEGLVGATLHGKTVGVVGTGQIGQAFTRIMAGFGCKLLLHDLYADSEFAAGVGGRYVSLEELFASANVVALHLPLSPVTRHLVGERLLSLMRPGSYLVNTARGGLVDTEAVLAALAEGRLKGVALDVYEKETGVFFRRHEGGSSGDPLLEKLLNHPAVLLTGHMAFLTREALDAIATATLRSCDDFRAGRPLGRRIPSLT